MTSDRSVEIAGMSSLDALLPGWRTLQAAARAARELAYAPYSRYHVGAAVMSADGWIAAGCNVENASYGLTICAERVAIGAAVAGGHRDLVAVCVSLTDVAVPCGACRQVLHEFNPNMLVLLDDVTRGVDAVPEVVSLAELLPRAFRLKR